MIRSYAAVGSNNGPERNIILALKKLRQLASITGISTFFRTEPIGRPEQDYFYNGVVAIESSLPPEGIKWGIFRKIEKELGREHISDRYAPRSIDLDLILYGDRVIRMDGLVIPDPDIYTRPFLAIPLLELDPLIVLPDSQTPLVHVVQEMDTATLVPLRRFTEKLKKELGHEP